MKNYSFYFLKEHKRQKKSGNFRTKTYFYDIKKSGYLNLNQETFSAGRTCTHTHT